MVLCFQFKGLYYKWENDIQYYEETSDVLSLPRWDVRTLACGPFINRGGNHQASWFHQHLMFEVNHGFNFFKPHVPTRNRIDEIDPRTGWRKLVFMVKPPRTMKRVPVKMLNQHMYFSFNRWYYDNRTGDAVIVLGKGLKAVISGNSLC